MGVFWSLWCLYLTYLRSLSVAEHIVKLLKMLSFPISVSQNLTDVAQCHMTVQRQKIKAMNTLIMIESHSFSNIVIEQQWKVNCRESRR